MSAPSPKSPTLTGWLVRDLVILLLILAICSGLTLWQQSSPGVLSATLSAVIGFISAYVLCYIVHEWGHLIGAKLADAHMPLYGYKGVLLGQFDPAKNSTKQFLFLSWGGVVGYTLVAAICLAAYFGSAIGYVAAGLAVGGLAFIVQSWAVDLPQIFKVMGGADPAQTNREGASGQVILRRTWQTWLPLAAVIILWNVV